MLDNVDTDRPAALTVTSLGMPLSTISSCKQPGKMEFLAEKA